MSPRNITFIDQQVLDLVESRIMRVLAETHATAILLIDQSGVVVAQAGTPPLHPDQMGAVASGVFSAMSAMIKASRAEHFVVRIPMNNANFQFHNVDGRLFLCAFYGSGQDEAAVEKGLTTLATEARNSLTDKKSGEWQADNISFIQDKLNELFGGG